MDKDKDKIKYLINFHRQKLISAKNEFNKQFIFYTEKKLNSLDVYFTIAKRNNEYINVVEDCLTKKIYAMSYIENFVYGFNPCYKTYQIICEFLGETGIDILKKYILKLERCYENILKYNKKKKRNLWNRQTKFCYRAKRNDFIPKFRYVSFNKKKKQILENELKKINQHTFALLDKIHTHCNDYLKRNDIIKKVKK